jgi:CRP-like cAMP-binding protein
MDTRILLQELQSLSDFKAIDFDRFLALFEQRTFSKGDITRCTYFIIKGCIRQFYLNDLGKERTVHFATEQHWTGDLMSLLYQKPTQINVQVLEDSEGLTINRQNIEYAVKNFPDFAWYLFLRRTKTIARFKQVMGSDAIDSPESKYATFKAEHPDLLLRLPQYHIASYLGITPETLSRIRKKNNANGIS